MKSAVIIGGGISGLACLHFLKKRFKEELHVLLYEREAVAGGSIQSIGQDGFLFETGPNGFLTNQPATFELIADLGLSDQVQESDARAKRRYIFSNGRLHLVPSQLTALAMTRLLTLREKYALIRGLFRKDISKDQSVYAYAAQRFGPQAAQKLFGPLATGIYAGDAQRLHMASVFSRPLRPGSKMVSLKRGMGQLIGEMQKRYARWIRLNHSINDIQTVDADMVIFSTPAPVTAALLNLDFLCKIHYVPIAVVGLGFASECFKTRPDGFGYLSTAEDNSPVLGAVVESNVFSGRVPDGNVMLRFMIGGRRCPEAVQQSAEALVDLCLGQVDKIYGLRSGPGKTWTRVWPRAIPQYEHDYPLIKTEIQQFLALHPRFHFVANYLRGVSFNDCVNNAKTFAQSIAL